MAAGIASRGRGSIEIRIEMPSLEDLRRQFRALPANLAAKHLGAALRRASKPGLDALRAQVKQHRGPTGNLARSIATKVKRYRNGNAVALVGFTAAGSARAKSAGGGTVQKGKDRAFHQGFLEFGTGPRFTKGPIASSFNRLGPFKIKPIAKRGKFKGVARVQTTPKYPRAFFSKGSKGRPVDLKEMPRSAPIKTAFLQSRGAIESSLRKEMEYALSQALKDMANDFSSRAKEFNFGGGIGPTPF